MKAATYNLAIRPEPAGVDEYGRDASYRLKRLLKDCLRQYGFRCVGLHETKPDEAPTADVSSADEGANVAGAVAGAGRAGHPRRTLGGGSISGALPRQTVTNRAYLRTYPNPKTR